MNPPDRDSYEWQLPEGIDEVLPPRARELELARRTVLDVFDRWGFEQVEPPVLERLESLLVGASAELESQTFKLIDPESGSLLALRPEMTSQALRIDSHSLREVEGPARYCYAGPVARSHRSTPLATRLPYLAGAELFGSDAPAADAEVITLLAEVLTRCGVTAPLMVLGHVGVFRALVAGADLSESLVQRLYTAVQDKSAADVDALSAGSVGADLIELTSMMGDDAVLARAREAFGDRVSREIDELELVAEAARERLPGVRLFFDLGESRTYGYHTGVLFSAFGADRGQPLARGGRYDYIGGRFGRSRAATGFDLDLKQLPLGGGHRAAIFAPADPDPALQTAVSELRSAGERVVQGLDADEHPTDLCDRVLHLTPDGWTVRVREETARR